MLEVRQTAVFEKWLRDLRDDRARSIIQLRLDRLATGHVGDFKSVGGGVGELRVHFGPGYRLYFLREGEVVIVLLCGGRKADQRRDIERAIALAHSWRT